jgi:hypothetical protein
MKSQARIDAGRRNGMLAKGKKSEEARQKCAQNSVKHGIFAKTLVFANESPERCESIPKSYFEVWKPENEFEADLVIDMVSARWRLNRIMTVETETIDLRQARMANSGELEKEFDTVPEPVRLALAYIKETNESNTLSNLSRYEARYYRQLHQAADQLRRVQKERRAQEAEEAITSEVEAICKNEGNAPPKPAPPTLEIVRPDPKPAPQPEISTPDDLPLRS